MGAHQRRQRGRRRTTHDIGRLAGGVRGVADGVRHQRAECRVGAEAACDEKSHCLRLAFRKKECATGSTLHTWPNVGVLWGENFEKLMLSPRKGSQRCGEVFGVVDLCEGSPNFEATDYTKLHMKVPFVDGLGGPAGLRPKVSADSVGETYMEWG